MFIPSTSKLFRVTAEDQIETLNPQLRSTTTHTQHTLSTETMKCRSSSNWESRLVLISLLSGASTSNNSAHSVCISLRRSFFIANENLKMFWRGSYLCKEAPPPENLVLAVHFISSTYTWQTSKVLYFLLSKRLNCSCNLEQNRSPHIKRTQKKNNY